MVKRIAPPLLEGEEQAFGVQNLVYVTMMNRSYARRYLSCVRPTIPLGAPCNDREKNQNGYQKGQKRQKGQKYRLAGPRVAHSYAVRKSVGVVRAS